MNIFDKMKGHSVVEANNLTGLRNGHMVAQAKFANGASADHLDNGAILALDHKNELELSATGAEDVLFLHYSEEHIKFLDNAPLDMFTLDLKANDIRGEVAAYPRAIALYEGDTFTTDAVDLDEEAIEALDKSKYYPVTVAAGVLTVSETEATSAAGTIGRPTTLPSGKAAMEIVWRGGKA